MPLQFNPFILGAMLVVAVGTAIYTYYASSADSGQHQYSQNSSRRNPSPPPSTRSSEPNVCNNRNSPRRRKRFTSQECTICLQPVSKNPHELSCGHLFHEACILSWFQIGQKSTCPNCRAI